jgi:hypothetical protein
MQMIPAAPQPESPHLIMGAVVSELGAAGVVRIGAAIESRIDRLDLARLDVTPQTTNKCVNGYCAQQAQ